MFGYWPEFAIFTIEAAVLVIIGGILFQARDA
jgi:hypothetical protein